MADITASGSGQQAWRDLRSDPVFVGSCDLCKRRKSKCDLKRPTCGSCDRHHRTCDYPVSRKKPGPRRGSKQARTVAVQRRLDRLEGLVGSNPPTVTSRNPVLPTQPLMARQNRLPETREEPPADQTRPVRVDPETLSNDATLQLQPLTAALRWHGHMKPGPSRLDSSEDPALSPLTASPYIILSQDTERQLISHFFTDVKLPVSVLCEQKFHSEYEAGTIPAFLLDAMLSLSARFSQAPEILGLKATGLETVGSYFRSKASAGMDLISGSSDTISFAEVTAAYLLAYYDFTNIPSRKAAEQCSKAVRMAYMAGLHQIDNRSFAPQATDRLSELELEEKRCLWWGIFMLDTFSSLSFFVPANIEDLSIASGLPTTFVNQLSSQHVFYPRRAFLDDDLGTFWSIISSQEPATARTQAVLIYVTALARDVTSVRRLCLENPRCNLTLQLNTLRQKWEMLLSTLPAWFFDATRHTLEITRDGHRKRLETLIMIHTLGNLSNYPPLDLRLKWSPESLQTPATLEDRWKDCVFHARKITSVYRAWVPEYCENPDSLMLPMTWNAVCLLILHTMNKDCTDINGRHTVWDSVDFMMDCLHRCSQYWNIARILMHSLEDLRAKSWMKVNITTIFGLLLTLSAPQMRSKSQVKVVCEATEVAAASFSSQQNVEDLMPPPTPGFWIPNTDNSAMFDWSDFIAGTDPSIWQT